jgi:hypothetical protein
LVQIGSKRCAFFQIHLKLEQVPRLAVIERAMAPADEPVLAGL